MNITTSFQVLKKQSMPKENLEQIKQSGEEIESLGERQVLLAEAIERSENFFLLGGLIAVLLSACTIGIASQRFTRSYISAM